MGPVISYVIDPRFPGGTSTAVARELRAVAGLGKLRVHAIESAMFEGRTVAPQLEAALEDLGLELDWDSTVIHGDLVLLHNPAFLKLQSAIGRQIVAHDLVVVAHENFLRDGTEQGFDVAGTLDQIDRASLATLKRIAPVSANNRASVEGWLALHGLPPGWSVLEGSWPDICDGTVGRPTDRPRDRRGRHSRPGFEKFPGLAAMDLCFPHTAESNVLLGADHLIAQTIHRPHWTLLPFGAVDVERYLGQIDFMVYFTAPAWHESFGLAIAEAIAAGKVVITDDRTARSFGDGVVSARPEEVSAIIARMIEEPALYRAQVLRGQEVVAEFSAAACRQRIQALLHAKERAA